MRERGRRRSAHRRWAQVAARLTDNSRRDGTRSPRPHVLWLPLLPVLYALSSECLAWLLRQRTRCAYARRCTEQSAALCAAFTCISALYLSVRDTAVRCVLVAWCRLSPSLRAGLVSHAPPGSCASLVPDATLARRSRLSRAALLFFFLLSSAPPL